ncbi:MAG: ERCC4 domain-containing protein [Candidatus Bathyarchaeia archaeon]
MVGKAAPRIIVDRRETRYVVRELERLGADIRIESIGPGDYVVSKGLAVERKSVNDFFESLFNKRLFEQVERLSESFDRCCLLIEGDVGHRLTRMRNPSVFWGSIAKIVTKWGASVIFTLNEVQSAQFVFSLARKAQEKGERVAARYKPRIYGLSRRQRFVVEGLPGIGPKLADLLLKRFGSVKGIFSATYDDLLSVGGLGKKRARRIVKLLEGCYLG